jgi:hypothetical protein
VNSIRYLDLTVWGGMLVEVAGSVLVVRWWSKLNRSGRLVGGWLLAATVFAIGGKIARHAIRNSLVVTFFWFPVSSIFAINALASMHGAGRSRSGLRALSWMMVMAWAILALTIEDFGDYSRITSPMHAILLAAAAAYTLITRVEASRTDLLRDAAFVTAAFWVIYAIPTVFLSVSARFWMTAGNSQQLLNYYSFRNTIVILSYGVLIYGIALWANTRPARGQIVQAGTLS